MKPNIRKAKLKDTADNYGGINPSFVGKWLCEWKSLQGFGDTIEQAVLNMEKDADFHAQPTWVSHKYYDAQKWVNQ
jgi:hypothetical protein